MTREQEQFLEVVDRDTAERRWWEYVAPSAASHGGCPAQRVRWVVSSLKTSRPTGTCRRLIVLTSTALPSGPRRRTGLRKTLHAACAVNTEEIATGIVPSAAVRPGTATVIATGGVLPRGADSVLMVEHTRVEADRLIVTRPIAPGGNVSFAGTDMARGELVLRRGTRLTARETGVLAAIGRGEVAVVRRPRVAILSTGDEIIEPGAIRVPGGLRLQRTVLADAVRELGGEPSRWASSATTSKALEAALDEAWKRPTSCCFPAAPARGRATCRTGPCPGCRAGDRRPRRGAEAGQADLPGRPRGASRW